MQKPRCKQRKIREERKRENFQEKEKTLWVSWSCHANLVQGNFEQAGTTFPPRQTGLVVGAGSLDVTSLLALVANLLATSRLLGAVAGVVARLATVVAAHAVDTLACARLASVADFLSSCLLTRHVAVAAARVAGLAGTATSTVAVVATVVAALVVAGLGAVASNVANLTALFLLADDSSIRHTAMEHICLPCSTRWTVRCHQQWGTREKGDQAGRTCSRTCSPSWAQSSRGLGVVSKNFQV